MTIEVLGEGGKTVDWWFMYKLPSDTPPVKGASSDFKKTSGLEYLYFDADSTGPPVLAKQTIDHQDSALQRTLQQLYRPAKGSDWSLGWVCYNDEVPDTNKADDERNGHTKGVLAFDLVSNTAFWLVHSWPKFPDVNAPEVPSPEYAQTFLCVQLQDVRTARRIATQMYHQHEPQTYDCRLPLGLKGKVIFRLLAHSVDVNEKDPPCHIRFKSRGGEEFRLMAKNRHWGEDFWIDLVGPSLKVDMEVETWRRGVLPDTEDSDKKHDVVDTLWINLEHLSIPYEWHYTKDHAKWGVSKEDDWVVVADINRQKSQEKRGGGCICLKNRVLWECLSKVEQLKS